MKQNMWNKKRKEKMAPTRKKHTAIRKGKGKGKGTRTHTTHTTHKARIIRHGRTYLYTRGKYRPGIGPLRKGELSKYGYVHVAELSEEQRHKALEKAIDAYGSLGVWRKLNAVAVYTKRTSPAVSRLFQADMDWIRRTFGIKASSHK